MVSNGFPSQFREQVRGLTFRCNPHRSRKNLDKKAGGRQSSLASQKARRKLEQRIHGYFHNTPGSAKFTGTLDTRILGSKFPVTETTRCGESTWIELQRVHTLWGPPPGNACELTSASQGTKAKWRKRESPVWWGWGVRMHLE